MQYHYRQTQVPIRIDQDLPKCHGYLEISAVGSPFYIPNVALLPFQAVPAPLNARLSRADHRLCGSNFVTIGSSHPINWPFDTNTLTLISAHWTFRATCVKRRVRSRTPSMDSRMMSVTSVPLGHIVHTELLSQEGHNHNVLALLQ